MHTMKLNYSNIANTKIFRTDLLRMLSCGERMFTTLTFLSHPLNISSILSCYSVHLESCKLCFLTNTTVPTFYVVFTELPFVAFL